MGPNRIEVKSLGGKIMLGPQPRTRDLLLTYVSVVTLSLNCALEILTTVDAGSAPDRTILELTTDEDHLEKARYVASAWQE